LQRCSGLLDLPDRLEVVLRNGERIRQAEDVPVASNRGELRAHLRRHFWWKSTARKLFSGLGQRRRRGWDA